MDLEVVGGGRAVEDVQRATETQAQLPDVHELATFLQPQGSCMKSIIFFSARQNATVLQQRPKSHTLQESQVKDALL